MSALFSVPACVLLKFIELGQKASACLQTWEFVLCKLSTSDTKSVVKTLRRDR
jgi:hypothetical protein